MPAMTQQPMAPIINGLNFKIMPDKKIGIQYRTILQGL